MRTREEHLAWCKRDALAYLDRGELQEAVTAMLSDLDQHPETRSDNPFLTLLGMQAILTGDVAAARRFIEGFK